MSPIHTQVGHGTDPFHTNKTILINSTRENNPLWTLLCDRFGPECDKFTLTTIGNLYNWIYPECARQNQYHSDRSESIRSTPTIVLIPWYVHTWLELHIKSLSNFGSAVTVSPIGRRLQLFFTLHTGHKCTYTWQEPPTLMSGQWVFLHIINHIQL